MNNSSLTANSNRMSSYLNKSVSSNSLSNIVNIDEKMQRSQLNIDRKMREDFDRLQ